MEHPCGVVSDSAFGRKRTAILASVRSVQRNESLSDERRQHYFAEIYRRTVQDDVDALADLGFLSTPSPDWHSHLPEPLSPDRAATMLRLLAVLRAATRATSVRDAPASSRSTCSVA